MGATGKFSLRGLIVLTIVAYLGPFLAAAESVSPTVRIDVVHEPARKDSATKGSGNVAVWLNPIPQRPLPSSVTRSTHLRMLQKNKEFIPHMLVVPVGSSVEFPNLDPFYHNVFSLFNGKRFDLGLYEAGSTRTVHFDHEGVSYIFCNIHPGMGAVVIAVSTPYFAVSAPNGAVTLPDVPDGTYQMNVWAEGSAPERLKSLTRVVHITRESRDLGLIRIVENTNMASHKNKFGEDYTPDVRPY